VSGINPEILSLRGIAKEETLENFAARLIAAKSDPASKLNALRHKEIFPLPYSSLGPYTHRYT
jgi:hypothetical protein